MASLTINIKMKPWAVIILKPLWVIQVLCKCKKVYLPDWAFTISKPELKSNIED